MSQWTKGQRLKDGRYIVEELLGFGGFGVTYRARDQPSGQFVAIKTLNALQQSQPNFAARQETFVNEAMCLASCRHPHIVKVYPQLFQQDGLWCMVMEYIDGQDLASYLEDRGVLSEEEALRIIRQVGDALSYVHNQGFLHRDVKPANIILRRDNLDAVLIDFGLAREFVPGRVQSLTNHKTEGFAPIEQYERRGDFGAYTDVYALAATLYNVLTDKSPPPANFRKEFNIPLAPPKQHNPQISDRVNDTILQGMALEPKDRPQSVQEWLEIFSSPQLQLFHFENAFGLYEMHGNVWDWCADSWLYNYQCALSDGRAWNDQYNQYRLLRGGSWHNHPHYCRSACRYYLGFRADRCNDVIGFRVVSAAARTP